MPIADVLQEKRDKLTAALLESSKEAVPSEMEGPAMEDSSNQGNTVQSFFIDDDQDEPPDGGPSPGFGLME